MNMMRLIAAIGLSCVTGTAARAAPSAGELLKAAFDNWRATSSTTEVAMTVHRPDWERSLHMQDWTRGDDDALVRFTAPAQDAGNATLKLGDDTWVFNPKLNQVIKLPASMMAQSWMGSDFSYNDLAKANDLLTKYTIAFSTPPRTARTRCIRSRPCRSPARPSSGASRSSRCARTAS